MCECICPQIKLFTGELITSGGGFSNINAMPYWQQEVVTDGYLARMQVGTSVLAHWHLFAHVSCVCRETVSDGHLACVQVSEGRVECVGEYACTCCVLVCACVRG